MFVVVIRWTAAFACLLSPILCGVALWLARSNKQCAGLNSTNSRGLVACRLVTRRGLLSSLLIIAKQFVLEEAVHCILLGHADWAMCNSLAPTKLPGIAMDFSRTS
jgi:hypothetical protein